MCGRVGAGELTFESYSVGKHSAAAPAVVSAHSQLSATRLATLLHAARRWVHLLLAQVGVCCRLVASPIALVELYRTGQVWHVGGGHGSRDRHPTTRSGTNVRISQTAPTYDWTLPAAAPCVPTLLSSTYLDCTALRGMYTHKVPARRSIAQEYLVNI